VSFDYLAGAIPLTATLTFLMAKKDSRNDLERTLAKYACEAETNKPSINIVTSEISKSGHDPSLTVLNSDEGTQTTTDQTASEFHRVYTSREVVPYISLHPLGSGTFGWVDKVESTAAPSLGQVFARKTIQSSNWSTPAEREAIVNEVKILKRLHHGHIAEIISTYQFRREFCIVMLPVADIDLSNYLYELDGVEGQKERTTGLHFLWKWFGCLARAVEYLHENGVRHKDIKPANILTKGAEVYVTDFGIARDFVGEETTASAGTVGARSTMYCAPEIYVDGHRRGRKADVYSLGCVFLEMTTVLFGSNLLAEFNSMRRTPDGRRAYAANQDRTLEWIHILGCKYAVAIEALPRRELPTNMAQAAYALYWSFSMLNPDPENRPSASKVVEEINIRFNDHHNHASGCRACNTGRSLLNAPSSWTYFALFHLEARKVKWDMTWDAGKQTWDSAFRVEQVVADDKAKELKILNQSQTTNLIPSTLRELKSLSPGRSHVTIPTETTRRTSDASSMTLSPSSTSSMTLSSVRAPDAPYDTCLACEKMFWGDTKARKEALKQHMRTWHWNTCPLGLCNRTFPTVDDLNRHVRMYHSAIATGMHGLRQREVV
jgi:serine/threonine protein kinase